MKYVHIFLLNTLLISCSLLNTKIDNKTTFYLEVEPKTAEILTLDDNKLGIGSIRFDNGRLKELSKDGYLALKVIDLGYHERQIVVNPISNSQMKIKLQKITQEKFQKKYLPNFSFLIDDLLFDIIKVHEGISLGEFDKAKSRISKLIEVYPDMSNLYLLMGIIEINKKNEKLSQKNIQKALLLNPNNILAKQYSNFIKKAKLNEGI